LLRLEDVASNLSTKERYLTKRKQTNPKTANPIRMPMAHETNSSRLRRGGSSVGVEDNVVLLSSFMHLPPGAEN